MSSTRAAFEDLHHCNQSSKFQFYLLPVQYDAAVDPVIAKTKVKEDSQVAGRATVLVVPDLNVGNIVYKVGNRSDLATLRHSQK